MGMDMHSNTAHNKKFVFTSVLGVLWACLHFSVYLAEEHVIEGNGAKF